MSLRSFTKVAALALAAKYVAADCVSYGVDFQDGGVYFQNSLSTDPFTFVSQYEGKFQINLFPKSVLTLSGCQNTTAYNILIDPNGDQYLCTDTNLQPDDTDMLSTCPENKNQLFTGDWSVVILSNNADGDSIAYQRDFSLNVGPQQTTTTTPTVTYSTTTTPLTSTTSTLTYTTTVVAATPTTTVPSTTVTRTYKVTPSKVTISTTTTLYTSTKIKAKVSVIKTTTTRTPVCHYPTVATTTDKTCSVRITATPGAKKFRFARGADDYVLLDTERLVKERREFLAERNQIEKRAPDAETITITDTNTSDYPTSTLTFTEATITATYLATETTTATTTPATVTIVKGKSTAPAVTTTLPTPTRTVRKCTVVTTTISTTYFPT